MNEKEPLFFHISYSDEFIREFFPDPMGLEKVGNIWLYRDSMSNYTLIVMPQACSSDFDSTIRLQ